MTTAFPQSKLALLSLIPFFHCRKYIFAYVTLNSRHPSSPSSDDFNHLLSNSPHLTVYIQELDYHVNKREFVTKRTPWLLSMFRKLVRLQKLSISYSPSGPGRKLDWMSPSVRKVLLPLLHHPTLTRINLATIRNFALADLASCVNLKTLRMESLECSTGIGKFLEALPATPAMLERLMIYEGNVSHVQRLCDARRPDGKPIIDFSSLKKFAPTVARLDSMKELFGMFRNLHKINLSSILSHIFSLHRFDVTIIVEPEASRSDPLEYNSSLKGLFTMLKPSLPTLVDIYIKYDIDNDDETYDGPLAGLCHELEKMVGQNVVETIELLIWVYSGYDCTRWGELDDVLMGSPEGWPALRKVSLSFNVTKPQSSRDTDKALRELPMTKLVESKRVQFDFRVATFHYRG